MEGPAASLLVASLQQQNFPIGRHLQQELNPMNPERIVVYNAS